MRSPARASEWGPTPWQRGGICSWRESLEGPEGPRPPRPPGTAGSEEAERKISELTVENEILLAATGKRGLQIQREGAKVMAETGAPLAIVCRVLRAHRQG